MIAKMNLEQTLTSGQCFRFEEKDGVWTVRAGVGSFCRSLSLSQKEFDFGRSPIQLDPFWRRYFDIDFDYEAVKRDLSSLDPTLACACAYAPGITILNQDPWEALCSFVVSQNNNIKRIKGIISRMCVAFGSSADVEAGSATCRVAKPEASGICADDGNPSGGVDAQASGPQVSGLRNPGSSSSELSMGDATGKSETGNRESGADNVSGKASPVCGFPTPDTLAGALESDLRAVGLGFRAPYIIATAESVAMGRIDFEELRTAPLSDAVKILTGIKGIGPKVASCALLFGLHRLDAFPMDVWIRRVMEEYYPGKDSSFFGPYAGIAQQFLFHYIRNVSE